MKFTTVIAAAILGVTAHGAAIPDPNCRFPGQPCSRKREALPEPMPEPEAGWHSKFRYFPGQPISKREAEADPNCRFPGQPCS